MSWDECVKSGFVEKRTPDRELAKSLLKRAGERFDYFYSKEISIFTLEGVYEAVLELAHSLMALDGLKTVSHECAIEFLRGKYLTEYGTETLHRLRKNRHKTKYYGEMLEPDAIKAHLEKGRTLFLKLKEISEKKM